MAPRYDYECSTCLDGREVIKTLSQIDDQELCTTCLTPMERVLSATNINTSTCKFEAHHNWAFGKQINSKRQLKEAQKKLSGDTGKEIIEIGTDDLKSVKKKRKAYTY